MASKDKEKNNIPPEDVKAESASEPSSGAASPAEESAPKAKEEKKRGSKKTSEAEEKLAEAQKKYDELNDKYMRMLAEYDNYRKRTARDLDARSNNAKADFIGKLLPVADNFERALAQQSDDAAAFRKGVEMIGKQLADALSGMGAEMFGEAGDAFDPNIHTAVMHEENEELDENVVTDVFIKGCRLGDRIIRPATVKVAN